MTRGADARWLAVASGVGVLVLIVPGISVFAAAALSAAGPTSANVRVSPQDGRDYQQPSMAVDPVRSGHAAVAYQEGGHVRDACWLSLSMDGGRTWTPRPLIGAGGAWPIPEGFSACWNPAVAFGPEGTLYYLAQTSLNAMNPYSHIVLATSRDGGSTFTAPHPVDTAVVPPGARAGGDWWPSMAVDHRSGTIEVTWSSFTPLLDNSNVMIAASVDHGRTFAAPVKASTADQEDVTGSMVAFNSDGTLDAAFVDYTQWERGYLVGCAPLACDHGPWTDQQVIDGVTTYFASQGRRLDFTQGIGCDQVSLPNRPGGVSFRYGRGGMCDSDALVIASRGASGGVQTQAAPIGSGAALGCGGIAGPTVGHSCDPVHPSFLDHNLLSLAGGARRGRAYIAWWDNGDAMSDAPSRLHLAVSSDGGATWDLAPNPPMSAGREADSQHRPSLSISANGRLDIAFYDTSPDSVQRVFVTSAAETDLAFGPAIEISDASSNAGVGPLADDAWPSFGDHLAVASTPADTLVAWTDTRSGAHQTVYFGTHPVAEPSPPANGEGSVMMTAVDIGGGAVATVIVAAFVGFRWRTRRRPPSTVPDSGFQPHQ